VFACSEKVLVVDSLVKGVTGSADNGVRSGKPVIIVRKLQSRLGFEKSRST